MDIRINRLWIFASVGLVVGSLALAVDNPLKVALDGAVVHYNGTFYGMSGRTNGQMVVSQGLFDWDAPVNVLPENLSGPYELIYRNGLFYLYVQGKGMAVADQPLGPYSKLRRAGLSGDQMRIWQDASGAFFSVNRRSGSKKEGEIWLQQYGTPWKMVGKPDQLLDGRRGMWDSIDSADLGEPEIIDYRGNYYLLYAANHPDPRTGLREVGVAMHEKPTKIENTSKVADPVLVRNAERLARTYEVLLPTGEYGEWKGRYTIKQPEEGWMMPGFKLSGWRTGEGGYGFPFEVDGAQLFACRTKWQSDRIWVRREFDLPGGTPETPVLNIRHEGAVQVFINGKKVFETTEPSVSYSNFNIAEDAEGAFRDEDNVIAVQARVPKGAEYRFLDFGLFDAGNRQVEPTVYGLSNPRILTGPNGFEKWMLYHAWWNGVPGTGLDRVFFFDKELVVDGPSTAETSGYHPDPAQPTFTDSFPEGESTQWAERWMFDGGAWMSVDGALRQSAKKGVAKAYLQRKPAENYLFETHVRFPLDGKGDVGVVAWSDGEKDLIISVNAARRTWSYRIEPSPILPKRHKLPKSFKPLDTPPGMGRAASAPLHKLRITKNGGHFDVMLNSIRLLPEKPIITSLAGAGVPGFYCKDSQAEFDGVTFTVGWDEHDEYITGWGLAHDGTPFGGEWKHRKDLGLEQCKHSEPGRAFKGDLLEQYEFTVNVQTEDLQEGKERLYGVFPVFVDRDNYLQAMIDTRARELVITGKRNGRDISPVAKSLRHRVAHRHLYDKSTAYRNVTSWVYGLRSKSIVTGLDVRWLEGEFEHLRQEFEIPSDDLVIKYAELSRGREPNLWDDGRFYDADEPKPRQQRAGILNRLSIRPQVANYVGFGLTTSSSVVVDSDTGRFIRSYTPGENLGPGEELADSTSETDIPSRPQETLVSVEVESSYFFRCVKLEDRVIIELNGRPMATIEESWPASQVGLVTEGQPCYYNGITLMHLPSE